MDFRRTGQRDDRRRRILIDESMGPQSRWEPGSAPRPDEPAQESRRSTRRYTEAAIAAQQPRITDLIPVRPWLCCVLLLLGGCGVVAIEAAYAQVHLRVVNVGHPAPASGDALDVRGPGTLAACYRCGLLSLICLSSLMIYWLRRHKIDDYRGCYRVWLWTCAVALVAVVETSTSIHQTAMPWAQKVVPASWYGTGDWFWGAGLVLPVLLLTGRLLVEVRASRLTFVTLLSALILLTIGVVQQWGGLLPVQHVLADMLWSTAILTGHLALWFSSVLYLRHVYLDSQDQLPRPPATATGVKKSRGGNKRSARRDSSAHRDDEVTPSVQPQQPQRSSSSQLELSATAKSPSVAAPAKNSAASQTQLGQQRPSPVPQQRSEEVVESDEEDCHEDGRRLSKAERRRMRKLKRRQQHESAA